MSSLGNLATKDGLITLAGINSSAAQQNAGKNEHFRSFQIRYPPRKRQKTGQEGEDEKGGISLLSKQSLFETPYSTKKETYQRLLRLSPPQIKGSSNKRIGAVASGLAQKSEIIVFNATVSSLEAADIIAKLELPEKSEAADLDITLTDEAEFSLAYCDEHNIYEQTYQYDFEKKAVQKRPNGPRRVHQMPFPEALDRAKTRSKYRCLRFLNPQNIIVLANKPNKSGAELRVYHLYPTGPAIEILHKTLPSHIKQATSMDVCSLDADKNGNQQVVVAVAGQDISIEIFTADFNSATDTFGKLKSYNTFRDVHPQQMTKLCFAPFHAPAPVAEEKAIAESDSNGQPVPHHTPAAGQSATQYIRLASTSFGNTVVIDTFPLTPMDASDKASRYVLVHPTDEALWRWLYIIVISFVVLVTAFLAQSFAGFNTDDGAGAFQVLPQTLRDFLDQPARAGYHRGAMKRVTTNDEIPVAASVPTDVPIDTLTESQTDVHVDSPIDVSPEPSTESATPDTISKALWDFVAMHSAAAAAEPGGREKAIIVKDAEEGGGLSVHVHDDKDAYLQTEGAARHWDELEDHQRSYWKEKLISAGQWAEHEGEAVLKGCLWSTYAGLVGQAAQEVLREL